MINLFKQLVKVTVSSLLIAVALNWYGRHQDTVARLVSRLQLLKALL